MLVIMPPKFNSLLAVLCLLGVACNQDAPDTTRASRPAGPPITPISENAALAPTATRPPAAPDTTSEADRTPNERESVAWPGFEPPFGDRVDLFLPPQSDAGSLPATPASPDAGQVVVKGFVNLGTPRAVLQIGDLVAPLAEGESRYDIRVLSIDPPQVVLQRGGNRWTATLVQDGAASSN